MYTNYNLRYGIDYLGIVDPEVIASIKKSNEENLEHIRQREKELNKFVVPHNLTKKERAEMLRETQKQIDSYRKTIQDKGTENAQYEECEIIRWIKKKEAIKMMMKPQKEFASLDKAKAYPIEELIEFNRSGFVCCLFHDEVHGSMYWDKKRNKAHCFGACGKGYDPIDVYMKLKSVSFNDAVKMLS